MNNLTYDDICQTVIEDTTLLEVQMIEELNCGALPNANYIPLSILPILAYEHLDKDEPVLIGCRAGDLAMMAEKILTGKDFNQADDNSDSADTGICH